MMRNRIMWIAAVIAFFILGFYPVMGWIPIWFAYVYIVSDIQNLSLSTMKMFAFLCVFIHIALSLGIGVVLTKSRLRIGVPAVLSLVVLLFVGYQKTMQHDANFESSDGIWADGTIKFKNRDFYQLLRYFEEYKLTSNKENISLFRVTPTPSMRWLWSRIERNDPMWNVPYHPSRGLTTYTYLGRRLTDDEVSEITYRTEKALIYWSQKTQQAAASNGANRAVGAP